MSCEGQYYTPLAEKFKQSNLNDREINLINCDGTFSFKRMELFMAGFLRGAYLNLDFEDCFDLGDNMLRIRSIIGNEIKKIKLYDNQELYIN